MMTEGVCPVLSEANGVFVNVRGASQMLAASRKGSYEPGMGDSGDLYSEEL
jgi:hypothetical protein